MSILLCRVKNKQYPDKLQNSRKHIILIYQNRKISLLQRYDDHTGTGRFVHSRFCHGTSSATLYKDVSAIVVCVIYNNINKIIMHLIFK
jgi:hypothetical protein